MSDVPASRPAPRFPRRLPRSSVQIDGTEWLQPVLDESPVVVATLDRAFRYTQVNEALAAIRGRSRESFIGRTMEEISPNLWRTLEPFLRRVLTGDTVSDLAFSEASADDISHTRHWIATYRPLRVRGKIVGIAFVATDITSVRITERALRLRTDLYAMLSPTNRAVTESATTDELFRHVCEIAVRTGSFAFAWVGVPDDDTVRVAASAGIDESYLNEMHLSLQPDNERSRGPVAQSLLTGTHYVINDFLASTATEPWHDLAQRAKFASSAAFPIRMGDDVVATLALFSREKNAFSDELVSALTEITPIISFALQRFAQEDLQLQGRQELEQRDRAIAAISQGIVVTDPLQFDNPIVYVGPSFERLTGYSREEIIGRNARFLQGPHTNPRSIEELRYAIREGTSRTVEILNYRKDESSFWNSVTVTPVFDEHGVVTNYVGVQTDVTERRELEQQLLQSQKMEAVGTLAAGIAHDFNNMLLVIRGYSDLLAKRVREDDLKEMARRIDSAVQQAADVTHRLLAFSRQQILQPEPTDLNVLITETMWLWHRMLGDHIVLKTELDSRLALTVVDRSQIEQAIVNLITNACDAMDSGGTLSIRTRTAMLDDEYAAAHEGVRAGPHALVEIVDSGVGMDETTQRRVFEPFFTTKVNGTGLGLATVYGIVRQCEGHVNLESNVGQGTTFQLYFPATGSPLASSHASFDETTSLEGSETILVVEDLVEARNLLVDALEGRGYHVLVASNGREALNLMSGLDTPLDLLLTDIAMPEMNGRDLATTLLVQRPHLKVVFTSGYPSNDIVHEANFVSRSTFVEKPYLVDRMVLAVRELLN